MSATGFLSKSFLSFMPVYAFLNASLLCFNIDLRTAGGNACLLWFLYFVCGCFMESRFALYKNKKQICLGIAVTTLFQVLLYLITMRLLPRSSFVHLSSVPVHGLYLVMRYIYIPDFDYPTHNFSTASLPTTFYLYLLLVSFFIGAAFYVGMLVINRIKSTS